MTTLSPTPDHAAPDEPTWLVHAQVRIGRYLRFLGCPHDRAEDFAQDTLLAALRAFPRTEPGIGWLLTTARNRYRMHLRAAGREVTDLDLLHAQWIEVTGPDGGDRQLLALRRCLEELPERSARAITLRYGDGAARPAIGKALGLGDEGVKSLLERVRAALAVCVQKRMREEP